MYADELIELNRFDTCQKACKSGNIPNTKGVVVKELDAMGKQCALEMPVNKNILKLVNFVNFTCIKYKGKYVFLIIAVII